MLLLNLFVNSSAVQLCTMSHHDNSPFSQRKRHSKYPPVSLHNNHNKLKKVTSGSSNVADPEYGQGVEKSDSFNTHSNAQKPYTEPNSSNRTDRSNDSINEREISNCDLTGQKLSTLGGKLRKNSPPFQTVQSNRKLEKESDLVGMLGKQLYLAESQMQRMQVIISKGDDRLKDKNQEIGRLQSKVREWEAKFKNQEIVHKKELQKERKQVEDSEYLYRRCLMLEHKIYEMEKFLADYDLVWVGDVDKNHGTTEGKHNCEYIKNCYTQLVASIEELNMAAGKGEVHVHRDKGGGGASFKTSPCMSLKFYKNGLVVHNGHLRPYDDATATSFIRDILDGYFPSELQNAYPQGVPFKVEDHRTETFLGSGSGFPGHGYRLGKVFRRQNSPSTSACVDERGLRTIGSSRYTVPQKQNFYSLKPTVSPLPRSNAKSTKSKSSCDTPATDMMQLRSQILASHNNNCSDSHVQSHINAELGLNSSRIEKKRELATKDAEYHISVRERALNLKGDIRVGSQRYASGSRPSYHSSTDRSLDQGSPGSSRLESACSEDGRSRSRSASLPGRRLRLRSLSKGKGSSGNTSTVSSKISDYTKLSTSTKKPRATRSATLERKSATAPLLHQINEPTRRAGELRLKVRSLNGSVVYLVHLCADDTVARLYHHLDTCMVKTRSRGYKIVISGYEPKRLDQLDLSLREYGILRDSVLHVIND